MTFQHDGQYNSIRYVSIKIQDGHLLRIFMKNLMMVAVFEKKARKMYVYIAFVLNIPTM